MKKLFLLMLGMLMTLPAFASVFTYTYEGQTLGYYVLEEPTVDTPVGKVAVSKLNYVSGDLKIPESVVYGGVEYSVTGIGNEAFYYCTSLTSVTIPNSVTYIGSSAFWVCTSLTSVTIPNSVTEIGYAAFACCTSLTSVTIPNSVTYIGSSAFWVCTSLTSVTIPNSVTEIGDSAFYRCTSLTSVTIPNSVTEIGDGAFNSCTSLTSVYYNTYEPINGSYTIFYANPEICEGTDSIYDNATLYVPAAAVEKCKQIDPWKNFRNIQAYDFSNGVEDAAADFDADAPYEVYSLSGMKAADRLDGLAPGVYILRQGRAVKKVTVK